MGVIKNRRTKSKVNNTMKTQEPINGLPDVTSADDGKILAVENGSWVKVNASGGSFDINAEAPATTNMTYNGASVYVKLFTLNSATPNTWNVLDPGTNLLKIEGVYNDANNTNQWRDFNNPYGICWSYNSSTGRLQISYDPDATSTFVFNARIILYYY